MEKVSTAFLLVLSINSLNCVQILKTLMSPDLRMFRLFVLGNKNTEKGVFILRCMHNFTPCLYEFKTSCSDSRPL